MNIFDYEGLRLHWCTHSLAIQDDAGCDRLPMDWTAAELETVANFMLLPVSEREDYRVHDKSTTVPGAPACDRCAEPCWLDPATKRFSRHCRRHHLECERLRLAQVRSRKRLAKTKAAELVQPQDTPAAPAVMASTPATSRLQAIPFSSSAGRTQACKVRHYHGVAAGYYTSCHLCGWAAADPEA